MYQFRFKSLTLAIALAAFANNASADLYTPKAEVTNAQSTDRLQATVRFPTPVTGDLYVAALINQQLYFLADSGQKFTTEVLPFLQNQDFSADIPVLDISSNGIPVGNYPLYEVVTIPGADPLNFANWIGGPAGLSVITFNVVAPPPALDGKTLYQSSSCASSACHGSDPGRNQNGVLAGTLSGNIRNNINRNRGGMGFLSYLTDAELQAIANYLSTF